jgi:hypothetical protein
VPKDFRPPISRLWRVQILWPSAITATAKKLAILIWNMFAKCQPYRGRHPQVLIELRKHAQMNVITPQIEGSIPITFSVI